MHVSSLGPTSRTCMQVSRFTSSCPCRVATQVAGRAHSIEANIAAAFGVESCYPTKNLS